VRGIRPAALALALVGTDAHADQPIAVLDSWSGPVDFFATGAPLAVDGPDADATNVDVLLPSASVDVGELDVPPTAVLRNAFLYWGGSIDDNGCADASNIDDAVDLTPPGGVAGVVVADACFCSEAGALAYDVQMCRADITSLLGLLGGTYTVGGFDALVSNQSTNNASFSVVIVFAEAFAPPRRVAMYDGLQTLSVDVVAQQIVTLEGIDVDDPPMGDLTWYVLEGDVGGSAGEQVEAAGVPGGATVVLADAINPLDNPMNHTINTTVPAQPDTIGVDIDTFALDAALAGTDTAVDVTYSAGMDKFWIAYNVVGVAVFEPVLGFQSSKDVVLFDDVGADGDPSPGDTLRYTIHLANTGNAAATVDLDDPIAPEASSWALVDSGGGVDQSLMGTLVVTDIPLPIDATADIAFDVVIADVPDGTLVSNTASYAVEPGGAVDQLTAPDVVVVNPLGAEGSSSGGAASESDGSSSGATGATSDGSTGVATDGTADATGAGAGTGGSDAEGVGTIGATADGTDAASSGAAEPDPASGGCGCGSRAIPSTWWGLVALGCVARRLRVRPAICAPQRRRAIRALIRSTIGSDHPGERTASRRR
jgi:hypothetical protein